MAQESQSMPGAQAIRSLQDEDSVFKAFDDYPWTKDEAFKSGLFAILGDPNSPNPQGSPTDMATHARIFYYARRVGVSVDFAQYQAWLARNPDHQAPKVLPDAYLSSAPSSSRDAAADEPALEWQQAAPKAELFVDRQQATQAADGAEPNYPMGFAEMLRLLQEGKPIPGIRQIPNTIARDPSVKPVGTKVAPKKPWEKNTPSITQSTDVHEALDADFPPVESDIASIPPTDST